MNPTQIGVFDLAQRRMEWIAKRQEILAQNIANANTPGFQPHDLKPFAAMLAQNADTSLMRTQPNHLAGTVPSDAQAQNTTRPGARAPDGNAVAIDTQLMKVADSETTQSLVSSIYKKYLGLFSMALGRGGSG